MPGAAAAAPVPLLPSLLSSRFIHTTVSYSFFLGIVFIVGLTLFGLYT